jgi:hypothetical protein
MLHVKSLHPNCLGPYSELLKIPVHKVLFKKTFVIVLANIRFIFFLKALENYCK